MPPSRIYQNTPLAEQQTVALDDRASHHLLKVLRMRSGEEVLLFNGDGREFAAELRVDGRQAAAIITTTQRVEPPVGLHIHLLQGVSRGDRMDWCLQKAVELGVTRITPVYCERSLKAPDDERLQKKRQHWHGIIVSACEQSGRCRVPELDDTQPLSRHLQQRNTRIDGFVLDPAASRSLGTVLTLEMTTIDVLIGPEGGLTTQELQQAQQAGLLGVSIGPRILRTETAGVAALAVIQAKIGDLR